MNSIVHTNEAEARFDFPEVKAGFNPNETVLDFSQANTILETRPSNYPITRQPFSKGFAIQHENNRKFCARLLANLTNSEPDQDNRDKQLRMGLDKELIRIATGLERSLSGIEDYFIRQLGIIRDYFDDFFNQNTRQKICYSS